MSNWITTSIILAHLWLLLITWVKSAAGRALHPSTWKRPPINRAWPTRTLPSQVLLGSMLRPPLLSWAVRPQQAICLTTGETEAVWHP